MMDPNALYEIHIDNNGDAAEDLTFQFQFNNKLNDVSLPIGGKNVAIPLIQAGPVANVSDANLNVNETYTVNLVRGDRRKGGGSAVTKTGGGTTFEKPVDYIGVKTLGNTAAYAAYANKHIHDVKHPRLPQRQGHGPRVRGPAPGRLRGQPGAHLRPGERAAVGDHQPGEHQRRRRELHPGPQRDHPGAGSAQGLPDRRQRDRDRRLDLGQPAAGAPALRRCRLPATRATTSPAAPGSRSRASASRWSTKS